MNKKIVFFGSGWYTIQVLEKILPHGLGLVITTEKSGPIPKFCGESNIKIITATNRSEIEENLETIAQCDMGVLASYGVLIPDKVLTSLRHGMINIHPSLLPKYKGPSPVQYQLLNGETTVGVTIIKMDNEFDHGPILSQKPYNLQGDETAEDLLSLLFEIGADLVVEQIKKIERGEKLEEKPQDHDKETWSDELTRESGKIDINNPPSREKLNNMIRAFYPWPGVWLTTTLKGQTKIVKLLPEKEIQVEGKKPMNIKDFINGYNEEGQDLLTRIGLL